MAAPVASVLSAVGPPGMAVVLFSQASPLSADVITYLETLPPVVGKAICAGLVLFVVLMGALQKLENTCVRVISVLLISVGAVIGFPLFPCLAPAALAFVSAMLMAILRDASAKAQTQFKTSMMAFLFAFAACSATWAIWVGLRFSKVDKWTDWTEQYRSMVQNEIIPWKVAFLCWGMPLYVSFFLFILGAISWFQMKQAEARDSAVATGNGDRGSHLTDEEVQLVSRVKLLGLMLSMLLIFAWLAASLDVTGDDEFGQDRADLRDEVIGVFLVIFTGLCLWLVYNLGPQKVKIAAENSKVAERVIEMAKSDWAQAGYLFCFAPFLLVYVVIRKLCGNVSTQDVGTDDSRQNLNGGGSTQGGMVRRYAAIFGDKVGALWTTSILTKATMLGLLYISFEVGAKATLVLLAYTNEFLNHLNVYVVSAVIFAVGTGLFLLPATPGPPVYIVTGIVVTTSAQNAGWSVTTAVIWAIAVGFAIKMSFAAIAQKFIGEPMAASTSIRSLVQVHTVEIRAIEMILKQPAQFSAAKVSILIGGPDWPVAVLCGILRLPLWPIMVGLSPVLVQSVIPCTISGALLILYADDPQKRALGETALTLAAALQLVALVVAGYYVQQAIEDNFDELQEERPQDKDVLDLEKESERNAEKYAAYTSIDRMPWYIKLALIFSIFFSEMSCYIVLGPWKKLFHTSCFKKFAVTSTVEEALGGNPMSIVLPLGWAAIACASISTLFLGIFNCWASNVVKASDPYEAIPVANGHP